MTHRQKEQQIDLKREEIKTMIKDLEPGTMLVIDMEDPVKDNGYAERKQKGNENIDS